MVIPQGKEGRVIVTVLMVDSPIDIAAKKSQQKHSLFRKITAVTGILSNKSPNAVRGQPNERSPSPIRNNMLSSDLIIHPPCDGKFNAELLLKNIIDKKQKHLVVKVSGTRLEILFVESTKPNEKTNEKHQDKINKKTKEKNNRLFKKNIFPSFIKSKRRNSDVESKSVEVIVEERYLKVHGQILLPDYIDSETLEFSMNCFGNLNIQADIKGAIRPSKECSPAMSPLAKPRMGLECPKDYEMDRDEDGFSHPESLHPSPSSSSRRYKGTTQHQGVFRPWVYIKVKGKKTRKNVIKSCSWELMTSDFDAALQSTSKKSLDSLIHVKQDGPLNRKALSLN